MAPTERIRRRFGCCLLAFAATLLAAGSQPTDPSGRATLSIRPPHWQRIQPAHFVGSGSQEADGALAWAGADGDSMRSVVFRTAGRGSGDDSESVSESDGCDQERAAPLTRAGEECSGSSEECGGGRLHSQSELHPGVQPWWGRIAGAPTMEEFSFDKEVVALCANRREPVPMSKLPLSVPPNVYQQLFMSKATCTGRAYGEPAASGEQAAWEDVCSMVPDDMPDVMPEHDRFESCAVVGNSGNLLKTRFGAEIDLHQIVMRFNDAPTFGFEKYVGSKTDYRIMNGHRFHIFAHDGRSKHGGSVKEMPHDDHATVVVSHVAPEAMAPDMHSALLVAQLHNLNINFTAMSHHVHDYTNHAMDAFAHCLEIRSKEAKVSKITSGVKAILTAMHICKRVSVYGVGDTSLTDSSIPYQYFTKSGEWSGRAEVSPHHNLSLEEAFLHALARSNLIRHCRYKGCQGGHSGHPDLTW